MHCTRRKCAKGIGAAASGRVTRFGCTAWFVVPGQTSEGRSAGEEVVIRVSTQKSRVSCEYLKKGQEPEYALTSVSEGATSTGNPSALVTAKEEMAPVRERLWSTQ